MARKARITHAAGYRMKKLGIRVEVRRDISAGPGGKPRFAACAWVSKAGRVRGDWKPNLTCRAGRNPRRAVATALSAIARSIADRRGTFAAFAGLGGYSKKHRKARRVARRAKR